LPLSILIVSRVEPSPTCESISFFQNGQAIS
jgi:hypothetical protein